MKHCSIEGCNGLYQARGWCRTHYSRWFRHGDPLGGRKNYLGDPEKAFWARIEKTDGCWKWTGFKDNDGYGLINVPNSSSRSNRFSWEIHHGEIPSGLCVLHKCDNPECCNPDHLFLGTNADNSADMVKKNRQAKGELSGRAILTEGDVVAIRKDRRTHKEIAASFGVGQTTIDSVKNRTTWKHIK